MQALAVEEPWLEWAGKRESDASQIDPVPLHAHERVSAKALLRVAARQDINRDLFADPQYDSQQAIEFYRHEMDWCNRLILGDSLQVMASLAQREGLEGKVKMIYFDPPYGIKYSGNFQIKVDETDVSEKEENLTREPEMIKAYRDTWRLGIHSYLTYLRDRLRASKELLHETGSIFIQIGEENLPLVSLVADEVLGRNNRVQLITFKKKSSTQTGHSVADYILWYAKNKEIMKPTDLRRERGAPEDSVQYTLVELPNGERLPAQLFTDEEKEQLQNSFVDQNYPVTSQHFSKTRTVPIIVEGKEVSCSHYRQWSYDVEQGMKRLERAGRLRATKTSARGIAYWGDSNLGSPSNIWDYYHGERKRLYVVQTNWKVIEQCLLLSTKPGDIALDPTCGAGTTAYVAEKWGRRWISIDTSRVAIAVARKRLMTSSFQYYKLKNSSIGVSGNFQYTTVPEITLRSIANNESLDPILDKHDAILDKCREDVNRALASITPAIRELLERKLKKKGPAATDADRRRWLLPQKEGFQDWTMPFDKDDDWPESLRAAVLKYRTSWREKMNEVNACIKEKANQIEVIDKPAIETGILRICGPFSIESVLPPEASTEKEQMRDGSTSRDIDAVNANAFIERIVNLMRIDGAGFLDNKRMNFTRLDRTGDTFDVIHAEGTWIEQNGGKQGKNAAQKVALVCGPRYGPVTAKQVCIAVEAAAERQFKDLVIAGFNFDATAISATDEINLQDLRVHYAHISPDLTPGMEKLLKEQRQSQLFNVFGKPRIDISDSDQEKKYTVCVSGIDIYDPVKNKICSCTAKSVAAWFLDSDYDGRTFCVTQAFFPNKNTWENIKKTLKTIVVPDTLSQLKNTRSLPFSLGEHRTIAVKVIDLRGNEVMGVRKIDE